MIYDTTICEQNDIWEQQSQSRADGWYRRELHDHFDCRDPDHIGCELCEDEEDEELEDDY